MSKVTILHLSDIHITNDEKVNIDEVLYFLKNDLERQQKERNLSKP